MSEVFEPLLRSYDEKRRAELVAAYMAVEYAAEPVPEVRFPALREPALRRTVEKMLGLSGRTLVRSDQAWISGYRDDVAAELAADPQCVPPVEDRAVLVLVLIHSVAIPRAAGLLSNDSWLSPYPTPVDELRRRTQLPIGELESALRRLRMAGLVAQMKAGGDEAGGFVPGPQFHRLTDAARRRLQEELILAAGPDSPLAAAIRARRRGQEREDARSPERDAARGGGPSGAAQGGGPSGAAQGGGPSSAAQGGGPSGAAQGGGPSGRARENGRGDARGGVEGAGLDGVSGAGGDGERGEQA
ncbi:hypothetical protein [Actinomadura yumaensis]|uniref:DprA-like winged helix domain-containing protein n=1 Tax=Actinomadura yumaensis TaxID=111807 RepID=UPI0036725022